MQMYNADLFDPPAPIAQVTLRNPKNDDIVSNVPMLLDSGADVTLIPSTFVNQLSVAPETDTIYELMGFDGNVSLASVVQLEMLFLNKTFRGRFLLIDQEWGVMGRDILNLLKLLFDGPNQTWNEQKRTD